MPDIDTTNTHHVRVNHHSLTVGLTTSDAIAQDDGSTTWDMGPDDARLLAAHLVAAADAIDPNPEVEFDNILEAVKRT